MEKVLQELFGSIFLSAHTVQMVPKCIWMRQCVFKNKGNMKGRLLINKMKSQISNLLSVLTCCLYHDRSFIYIVTNPLQINLLF